MRSYGSRRQAGCLSGPVTSFQHSALLREQGCAPIFGRSQRAQARLIIDNIAHPDARPALREAAERMGLTLRGQAGVGELSREGVLGRLR
jgi:acyl-CoA hydrolase